MYPCGCRSPNKRFGCGSSRTISVFFGQSPRDRATRTALERFFDELERWTALENQLLGQRLRDLGQLLRLLGTMAAAAGLPRTVRGPGRVRVLSAELACDMDAAHVFVMGLGERSFPDLSAAEPFFDEADRQSLFAKLGWN